MPVEREVIVTNGGGNNNGLTMAIIIVLLIVVIIGVVAVWSGGFSFGGKSITLDVPKVTVSP